MDTLAQVILPGGATTVLHLARAADADAPLVLVLPAMGVPAGYYGPLVDELATHGVHAAVADYTGQGESVPAAGRGCDHGYTHLADEWLPRVLDQLRTEHDGPIVGLGHSLGGHILLAHLAHTDRGLDGLALVGSGTPHWRAINGAKTLAQTQLVGVVSRVLGFWPGDRLGFGGVQPRTLMREWAAFSRTGRLRPAGEDIRQGLRGRSLPVLVVDLDNDTLAPPRAVDGLVGMLAGATVDRWTFTKEPGDPGKPVSHYSFARSPEIIGERIAEWVQGTVVRDGSGPA